jgi:hypothetical protein
MNLSQTAATAALNAITALMNGGSLTFYSGTMPATPETALSGNTTLATFIFAAAAFSAPAYTSPDEKATASFVNATVTPVATGTVSFARVLKSDGATVVADLTVGTAGTDIIVSSVSISTSVPVAVSSLTFGMPAV